MAQPNSNASSQSDDQYLVLSINIHSAVYASCTCTISSTVSTVPSMQNPAIPSTMVKAKKTCTCPPSKYHTTTISVEVVDTWFYSPSVPSTSSSLARSIGWNTTVSSNAAHYFTTELVDVVVPRTPAATTLVWAGQTPGGSGGMSDITKSRLNPIPMADFNARVHYGTSPWSANGKGTLALPPALVSSPPAEGWFSEENVYICGYPTCQPKVGPSKFPIKELAVNSTADQCESLCIKDADCIIWQLGSASKGGKCESVGNDGEWTPIETSGGRAAGCNVAKVKGCGITPPRPPPPRPRPSPSPSPPPPSRTAMTSSLPVVSVLDTSSGTGVSVVNSLMNAPPNAYLDADGKHTGTFKWTRQWFRFGQNATPITMSRHILIHADDWRPAVGWMVDSDPTGFAVDSRVNQSTFDGGGSFADYRGEGDTRPYPNNAVSNANACAAPH